LRPVLLFQHVAAPRTTYAEAAQRTIAGQVSTNQGSPRGHVYVLVFDETHIRAGHEQRARAAAERFLRTRIRPGDRVALYSLPGPGPQIEFTADVTRVLRALGSVRGTAEETGSAGAVGPAGAMRIHEAYEITRGHQTILDRHIAEAMGASDARAAASRRQKPDQEDDRSGFQRAVIEDARALVDRADGDSRRFLGALADVIRTLRAVDGRKAVILFSEGFQTDNLSHELDDVAAAAAQSYSVVYAMDLNARSSNIDPSEETPRGGEAMTEVRDRLQALGILTGETGGTLVIDAAAQLDRVLAGIAETSEDYYLVGFMPARQQGSGYRRIQVNVTRPGALASARTGYLPRASVTPADRKRAIDAALRAPFAKQELQVEYTTYTLRSTAADMQRVILSLAAELPVASTDSEAADVVYVVRHVESGKVAASASDRIPLPAAPTEGGPATGTGFYRVQFELLPGTYLMRAVVREPGGLVGSADRRFQVRALSGPDISASDLVLGSTDMAGLPVRVVANPNDTLAGVFEVYGRTEAQLDHLTATADLVPILGGLPPLSSHAELQPVKTESIGVSRAVRVELPLAAIPPGEYLVRATVRDGRGTITELLRDVTVRAGTPKAATLAPVVPARFDPLMVLRGEVSRRFLEPIERRILGSATDELIMRGAAAFAKADYGAASSAFRAAQDSGAADPALAFLLGWALAAGGDDRAAITAWRSAIVSDVTHVPSYLALVDVYSRLGHPELALQVVRSGLRSLPESPELLDRLARLEGR
jgi:VWFA-related protein